MITFRQKFSKNLIVGSKRTSLSKRTLKHLYKKESPVTLIDLGYLYSNIKTPPDLKYLEVYLKYNKHRKTYSAFIQHFINLLLKPVKYTLSKKIHLVYNSKENPNTPKEIVELVKFLGLSPFNLQGHGFFSYLRTYLSKGNSQPVICVCNSISAWACSDSTVSNIFFAAYTSSNSLLLYDNKTGLEILCKFIQSNKLINKLGLDDLKHISLQYLYLLLLYIKYITKNNTNFYFDSVFFSESPFYKVNGQGYALIIKAHKAISYYFMTKPDVANLFLFDREASFLLNLQRLAKLLPMDVQILSAFKTFYTKFEAINTVPTLSKGVKIKPIETDNKDFIEFNTYSAFTSRKFNFQVDSFELLTLFYKEIDLFKAGIPLATLVKLLPKLGIKDIESVRRTFIKHKKSDTLFGARIARTRRKIALSRSKHVMIYREEEELSSFVDTLMSDF